MHADATEVGQTLSQGSFWAQLRILFFLDFQIKSPQNTKQKTETRVVETLLNFLNFTKNVFKGCLQKTM